MELCVILFIKPFPSVCVDCDTCSPAHSDVGLCLVPVSEGPGGLVRPVSPVISMETDPDSCWQQWGDLIILRHVPYTDEVCVLGPTVFPSLVPTHLSLHWNVFGRTSFWKKSERKQDSMSWSAFIKTMVTKLKKRYKVTVESDNNTGSIVITITILPNNIFKMTVNMQMSNDKYTVSSC